jgi:hypothetical protein
LKEALLMGLKLISSIASSEFLADISLPFHSRYWRHLHYSYFRHDWLSYSQISPSWLSLIVQRAARAASTINATANFSLLHFAHKHTLYATTFALEAT